MVDKVELYGKTLGELTEIVKKWGMPQYMGKQIAEWLYQHKVYDFAEMTNISKKHRVFLEENASITCPSYIQVSESVDGTKKYLYPVIGKEKFIEAVYIPDEKRNTLCISSQVGCRYACAFCMTGRQGWQGHLTPGEIVNQVANLPEIDELTNIVFMGMGEPFDNPDSVMNTLEILTSEYGLNMSKKRITVSTIGIIPAMRRFLEETGCHLAISIHSPFDEERKKLMPVQKIYPIRDVLDTLREFDFDNHRRVSFEYILFEGINDSDKHVKELVKILQGIRCRINLMRFHPIPNSPLKSPNDQVVYHFKEALINKGLMATVRTSRGMDIEAACGMLSTKKLQSEK
ncbi:23S rRNA m(2)A-2503 methyltransferase [Balneicella halophila]|uniref:Probable dual-specificity RNA methyltransferase RlmN n=1 Tax=Balneicella halophila TaxID=1537566 RepID=A0A7L4UQX5_BALHA|nr:23S rRNA (adenine(2503)-C(2))-methyltransferase RlmN [Balneicella halophila]PVX50699.1 23S rRNA m(2)A-2503 methyltransferase [Balneicella halophila]